MAALAPAAVRDARSWSRPAPCVTTSTGTCVRQLLPREARLVRSGCRTRSRSRSGSPRRRSPRASPPRKPRHLLARVVEKGNRELAGTPRRSCAIAAGSLGEITTKRGVDGGPRARQRELPGPRHRARVEGGELVLVQVRRDEEGGREEVVARGERRRRRCPGAPASRGSRAASSPGRREQDRALPEQGQPVGDVRARTRPGPGASRRRGTRRRAGACGPE